MPPSSVKCRCASLPQIVLGKTTKLPTKHFEVLTTKPHPANPFTGFGSERTWVTLGRCKVCGQLWQADAWPRRAVGWTSWPDLCIKMDTHIGWDTFDDRPLRLAYFTEMCNGVGERACTTAKCGDMAVGGIDTCANCTCRARYGTGAHDIRTWGPWSPARPSLRLSSGQHIPLALLHAVLANSEAAGVKALRQTYPNTSIGTARELFAELVAQRAVNDP
jgi:hypothetical protein